MVNFDGLIDGMKRAANENIKFEAGDFIGDDGLWYCGKCRTRKQGRYKFPGRPEEIINCLCDCMRDAKNAELDAERFERHKDELRAKCFVSEDMRELRFENDNGNNPKLIEICKKFVDNFDEFKEAGRGLLLYGKTGVGKSWAAGCIANALIDKGIACKFLDFTQIANVLADMREGREDYIQTLAHYPLLILDDLDAERNTSYMDEVVFHVVDARAKAKNPLIVTTNLSRDKLKDPKELTERRVISRLYGLCIPYEVIGDDQREKGLRKDFGHFKNILGI